MAGRSQQITGEVHGGAANLTNAGKGRKKGVPNRITKVVKDMVIAALDKAGGEDYLVKQAKENPVAFMTLLGKVIPLDVSASGNITVQIISGLGD